MKGRQIKANRAITQMLQIQRDPEMDSNQDLIFVNSWVVGGKETSMNGQMVGDNRFSMSKGG